MSTSVVGPGRQPAATHAHSPRYVVGAVPLNNGDDAGYLEAVDRFREPTGPSSAPATRPAHAMSPTLEVSLPLVRPNSARSERATTRLPSG